MRAAYDGLGMVYLLEQLFLVQYGMRSLCPTDARSGSLLIYFRLFKEPDNYKGNILRLIGKVFSKQ